MEAQQPSKVKKPADITKVIDQLPMLVCYLDKDLRYQAANETYRKWFGWDPQEMIGRRIEDLIGPGPAAIGIPYIKKALNGEVVKLQSEMPYKDGGSRYIEAVYTPDFDETGHVVGLNVIVSDISEKMTTVKALENSESQFRALFNLATVGIGQNDPRTGYFLEANERFQEITGYSLEELRRLTIQDITHPYDRFKDSEGFQNFLKGQYATYQTEKRYIRKDGDVIWVRLEVAIMARDQKGNPTRTIGTVIDITKERQAAQMLAEREAYFRDIVDVSPALVWMTDVDSKCTYLSRQWYEFTGSTPETDLGYGWTEHVHPEDRKRTEEMYFSAVQERGPLSIDYRLRRKDGEYRWMVDIGHPRINADGIFLGYVGTVTDIHDRIIAEKNLRGVTERFARSAKSVNLGVWYCDLPFNILQWNEEVKKHFFLPPDAVVTIDLFYEIIHPDDREKTRQAIESSISGHLPYDIYYRTVNPNNSDDFKWIRAVGWTDYNEQGQPIRFDGITLDATEEIKKNKELEAARDEAQRANDLKSAFLANMSHEIRTPLGAMIGFSDLLRDPDLKQEQRLHYLDILCRNGESLNAIINDILDLSKVEAGHLTLEYSKTDPSVIAEDIVTLLKIKAQEKNLELNLQVDPTTPKEITTDPLRIRQILLNIIGNAIKFTQSGSVTVKTFGSELSAARKNLGIEVCDTGIGITHLQKEKIFDMFVQADGSTTRRFGGTGLGLSLSRRLARALGGDVTITDSTPGQGTRFLIAIADQPNQNNSYVDIKPDLNPSRASKIKALENVSVLVVDDAADNQKLIGHYLTRQGAKVDFADNGLLGLKKALSNSYDIVLMDIQMPEMDGYTATRELRQAGFKKPIIALTAHAMNEVRDKILRVGANVHLPKPINFKDLISTITEHL